MERCGAVEEPVLVVVLGRVRGVARSLDDRDDMPLEVDDIAAQPCHCPADAIDRHAEQMPAVLLAQALRELLARQAGIEEQLLVWDAESVHQIARAALAAGGGEDWPGARLPGELNRHRA